MRVATLLAPILSVLVGASGEDAGRLDPEPLSMHLALQAGTHEPVGVEPSAYRSAAYSAALLRLARFAKDDTAPILLQGESGTGKTSLARYIHATSPRSSGPCQHVVLSTLEDSVASSELFGHVIGAFTDARRARTGYFASANGGTLFLDEIGKASRSLQAKLLHAIEYGEIRPVGADRTVRVNVRIVAASNVDLADLVAEQSFLPDLYARLATFRIVLPALRERRADISILIAQSIRRHARAAGYPSALPEIDGDLMRALHGAPWPNNLRELDATIHRLLVEAEGAMCIGLGHCTEELSYLAGTKRLNEITPANIDEAMRQARSLSGAARILGVDRKTLRRLRGRGAN